jgi:hypothetical protein
MDPTYCFKIAFQTHVGNNGFRVMPFALIGAPHSI